MGVSKNNGIATGMCLPTAVSGFKHPRVVSNWGWIAILLLLLLMMMMMTIIIIIEHCIKFDACG